MKSLDVLAQVLSDSGRELPDSVDLGTRLREDLGFDSLELAVVAVHIEARFGVDVFANRICRTVGDIEDQLTNA